MDEGATAAIIVAAAAVLLALVVTRRQEAATAMSVSRINHDKQRGTLTGGDVSAGVVAGVATYYLGPAGGRAALAVTGKRL